MMISGIIKAILIFSVMSVGGVLFEVAKISKAGALPMAIIAIGTFAALRAIWKYKPKSTEVTLNKKDD